MENKGRVQSILNMKPEIFKIYLEELTLDDIIAFKENQEIYGVKGNLSSNFTLRSNNIYNLLNNRKYSDTTDFDLKLAELAVTFSNDEFFESLAYYDDALSDERIASVYNTPVENVKMKKMYDIKAVEVMESSKKMHR